MQQEEPQQMPTQASTPPQPQPPQPTPTTTTPATTPTTTPTTPATPREPVPQNTPAQRAVVPVMPPYYPGMPPTPMTMMMPPMAVPRFAYRHTVFKLGILGLAVATILFATGFSVPAWADNTGLWMTCKGDTCDYYVGLGPRWLDAVRSVESVALFCFVLGLLLELFQDVCQSPPRPDNKAVEILGIAAGVFGVVGLALFGAKQDHQLRYHYNSYNYFDGYDYYYYKPVLNWGFWLAVSGVILGALSSVLIAFSRVRHAKFTQHTWASRGVYTMQHTASLASAPMGYPVPAYPYPNQYLYPGPGPHSEAHVPPVPAQGMPASHMVTAQGMPASQIMADQGMPASQMTAAQEMPASQMMAAQEMPASQTTAAEVMPTSLTTAVVEMPASQMMDAQDIPASQMTAAQEMLASQTTAAQEKPASQMTAAREMPASQTTAAQEIPASQMTTANGIAMATFTPALEDGTEEEIGFDDILLSGRL